MNKKHRDSAYLRQGMSYQCRDTDPDPDPNPYPIRDPDRHQNLIVFLSSPNLSRRRLDVYHTSFHTSCGLTYTERRAWCYLQVKLCDPCLSAIICQPFLQISCKSGRNFLRRVANRQTNRKTDRQTNNDEEHNLLGGGNELL